LEKLNQKKILIWTSSFYPRIGGLESSVMNLSKFLISREWTLKIITNKYPRILQDNEFTDNIEISRFYFFNNPMKYIISGRVDLFISWILLKPITIIRLYQFFKNFKPQIVNLHFPDHQLFECLILKYIFKFKLIISLHGNDVEKFKKIGLFSFRSILIKTIFNSADLITGCSKYLLNEFRSTSINQDHSKCFLLYNGVDNVFYDKHKFSPKEDYIFSVGRPVPIKGFDILLKAYQSIDGYDLMIAGTSSLSELTKTVNPSTQIQLLGNLSSKQISKFMRRAKITIIPSRGDSFGIVVAEAICSGSPVIATKVGGIPEVINIAKSQLSKEECLVFDRFVRLVDPHHKAISDGAIKIINGYDDLEQYIAIIPKIGKQFNWENRFNDYDAFLINKLLGI